MGVPQSSRDARSRRTRVLRERGCGQGGGKGGCWGGGCGWGTQNPDQTCPYALTRGWRSTPPRGTPTRSHSDTQHTHRRTRSTTRRGTTLAPAAWGVPDTGIHLSPHKQGSSGHKQAPKYCPSDLNDQSTVPAPLFSDLRTDVELCLPNSPRACYNCFPCVVPSHEPGTRQHAVRARPTPTHKTCVCVACAS
jgi:hypothetical protein